MLFFQHIKQFHSIHDRVDAVPLAFIALWKCFKMLRVSVHCSAFQNISKQLEDVCREWKHLPHQFVAAWKNIYNKILRINSFVNAAEGTKKRIEAS